jgi:hypothetical protein
MDIPLTLENVTSEWENHATILRFLQGVTILDDDNGTIKIGNRDNNHITNIGIQYKIDSTFPALRLVSKEMKWNIDNYPGEFSIENNTTIGSYFYKNKAWRRISVGGNFTPNDESELFCDTLRTAFVELNMLNIAKSIPNAKVSLFRCTFTELVEKFKSIDKSFFNNLKLKTCIVVIITGKDDIEVSWSDRCFLQCCEFNYHNYRDPSYYDDSE